MKLPQSFLLAQQPIRSNGPTNIRLLEGTKIGDWSFWMGEGKVRRGRVSVFQEGPRQLLPVGGGAPYSPPPFAPMIAMSQTGTL